MDGFEINKILGAFFGALLLVLGINEVTKILYHVDEPTQKGYVVEGVAEEPTTGTTSGTTTGGGEPVVETLPDFGSVLANADLALGEQIAKKCTQCHTWNQGGPNKIGPNLYGIVGNIHAHLGDGFAYSTAMRETPGVWDYESLDHYLKNPRAYLPGTKMAFAGLRKSEERIALIAFMRTWSDSPLPLPAPMAITPVTDGTLPADGAIPATNETPAAPPTEAPAEVPAASPTPGSGG